MSAVSVVFLGINDVGMRIYEWLCDRESVTVEALLTENEQLDLVENIAPEYIVSVGYDHLVPEEVLAVPTEGCLNLHPGLLPYNRGKSPNVWSIVEGTPAGVTLHYMDAEFDTGEIVAQQEVETSFEDTGKDLHGRLEQAQYELFTAAWPDIVAGTVDPVSQDDSAGTYHTTQDFTDLCELDPHQEYTVEELLDVLRALTFPPFDNAYVELDGQRYYVDVSIRSADQTDEGARDGFIESY
jgi:methionyl-tRNA formyltransferase